MAKAKQYDDTRQKHLTFKPGDLVHIYWPEVGKSQEVTTPMERPLQSD
jgi:hypothetical protein